MDFKEEPNRFFLEDAASTMYAEITYTNAGDNMYIIDHTYVDPMYQGKGIAKELVFAVVEKARREQKKIVPLCPFAKAEFERNPDYDDVKR